MCIALLTVSACCACHMCWLYVCIAVLGAHLGLSVLAALINVLAICVYCSTWSAPGTVSACCTYKCVGYM